MRLTKHNDANFEGMVRGMIGSEITFSDIDEGRPVLSFTDNAKRQTAVGLVRVDPGVFKDYDAAVGLLEDAMRAWATENYPLVVRSLGAAFNAYVELIFTDYIDDHLDLDAIKTEIEDTVEWQDYKTYVERETKQYEAELRHEAQSSRG